jgi:chemotaxis family two-component system response regulator Rcp1
MSTNVLLVEDIPGDVRLTKETYRNSKLPITLHVATEGVEAMANLGQEDKNSESPRPDFILFDLNLPGMSGRDVLAEVKGDDDLRAIPTIILTTSDAEADILGSYQLRANCYLTKPVNFDEFDSMVKSIDDFWLSRVKLPGRGGGGD